MNRPPQPGALLAIVLSGVTLASAGPAAIHFVAVRTDIPLPTVLETIGFWEARLSLFAALTVALGVVVWGFLARRSLARIELAAFGLTILAVFAIPLWYYRANIVENRLPPVRILEVQRVVEVPVEVEKIVEVPVFTLISKLNVRQVRIDHASVMRAFDRDSFPPEALENFSAFHQFASGLFNEAEPEVQRSWGLESATLQKILLFAAVSGTLFEYGNRDGVGPGCSYWNERTNGQLPYTLSQRQFLNAELGCCDDYAMIMAALLDIEGIENRRLAGAGHVWNEFDLDGQTYLIDANTGLLTASSWANLSSADIIDVWQIPLAGSMPTSGVRYRPRLGGFAAYMLTRISQGGFEVNVLPSSPGLPLEDGRAPSAL